MLVISGKWLVGTVGELWLVGQAAFKHSVNKQQLILPQCPTLGGGYQSTRYVGIITSHDKAWRAVWDGTNDVALLATAHATCAS